MYTPTLIIIESDMRPYHAERSDKVLGGGLMSLTEQEINYGGLRSVLG